MKYITDEFKSGYILIQESLYNKSQFIKILQKIQKFCIVNKVQIELSNSHEFTAKGNPTPQSDFIVNALNSLDISSNLFNLKFFINNEKKVNLQKLSDYLCNPDNEETAIIKVGEFQAKVTDLRICQNYLLSLINKRKLDIKKFVSPQNQYNKLYFAYLLKDFSADSFQHLSNSGIKNLLKNLSNNQKNLLIFNYLSGFLNIEPEEVIEKYYVTSIMQSVSYNMFSDYKITTLEALSNCMYKQNPSIIMLNNDCNSLLFILPERKHSCKVLLLGSKGKSINIQNITGQLKDFIAKNKIDLSIEEEVSCEYTLNYDFKNFLVIVELISATLAQCILNKCDLEGFSYQDINLEKTQNNLINAINIIAIQRRDNLLEVEEDVHIFNDAPELIGNPNYIARHLLRQFSHYQSSFYDFFGYDVSKKRMNLVYKVINDESNKPLLKGYQDSVKAIEQCKQQGKLVQDLHLGLFIDKLIENSGWKVSEVAKIIDPSFIKIAKASHSEFARNKLFAIENDLKPIIKKSEEYLIRALFQILLKKNNLESRLNKGINEWLSEQKEIINSFANKETRNILNKEFLNILSKWRFNLLTCCDEVALKTRSKLPKDVVVKGFKSEKSGQLVEVVCYDKAMFALNEGQEVHQLYINNINSISPIFKKAHDMFFADKFLQIQAHRVLNILSDYKTPAILEKNKLRNVLARLLILFEDLEIQKAFGNFIDLLTKNEEDGQKSWKLSPKSILKNEHFQNFLMHMYSIANSDGSKIKLNIKLRNIIKKLG